MATQKYGCEQLQYKFQPNVVNNTIEANYSFSTGLLRDNCVVFEPFSRTVRYGRKQRGRNKSADSIFDDPIRLAQVTNAAEQLFSENLGPAIDRAIQLSLHQAMFQAGIQLKANPTQLTNMLVMAERKHLATDLGVKRGAPRGKKQSLLRFNKQTLEEDLRRIVRNFRREQDRDPSQGEAAVKLGMSNSKALKRARDLSGDKRHWRELLMDI